MPLLCTMNKLIDYIEKYDVISIFRHTHPDGDALGSQWGLATFINEYYPEKTVYVAGYKEPIAVFFPDMVIVSDAEIASSHAIVLDCATEERVDGNFKLAKTVLNIDHHPNSNPYGDVYIVDSNRSSTCEIVAELVLEKGKVSQKCASYFLSGILTDTIRFMIENTKPETLEVAAKLMRCGANINRISRHFFSGTLDGFKVKSYLSNHIEYQDGVATLTVTKEMRDHLGLSDREAKSYYTIMSGVNEFKVYGVFVETDSGKYIGSLRSQDVTINTICEKYNGGGHRLACGVNYISPHQLDEIKQDLVIAVKNYKEEVA